MAVHMFLQDFTPTLLHTKSMPFMCPAWSSLNSVWLVLISALLWRRALCQWKSKRLPIVQLLQCNLGIPLKYMNKITNQVIVPHGVMQFRILWAEVDLQGQGLVPDSVLHFAFEDLQNIYAEGMEMWMLLCTLLSLILIFLLLQPFTLDTQLQIPYSWFKLFGMVSQTF